MMTEADINQISINFDNAIKNERELRQFMFSKNFPPALQDFLIENINQSPMRYFICDDSGSMMAKDGERYNENTGDIIKCSRWDELLDTIKFQIDISNKGLINSKFMFLNAPPLEVGTEFLEEDKYSPCFNLSGGGTPLCRTLNQIIDEIKHVSQYYYQNRKFIVIVISTDGVSSDGDIQIPLRELKNLPVKIILRLCTNDDSVVDYWNQIDTDLELKLDVVDDYVNEARELANINPWLTYGLPLHRIREFGLVSHDIDGLDEMRTDNSSITKIARVIFGKDNVIENTILSNNDINNLNNKFDIKTTNPLNNKQEYWIKNTAIVPPEGDKCCIIM